MKPIERVLHVLKVAAGPDGGGEYRAFCPAHEDRNTPNLRVREAEDGRVLLRCFAGCTQDQVLEALEKRGVDWAALFARVAEDGGGGTPIPPNGAAKLQRSCTFGAYAEAKSLPAEFLEGLSLSNATYAGRPAVRIPYLAGDGTESAVRFRLALTKTPEGDDRFRWRKGSKLTPYGLWRLEYAHKMGHVFLVEGESDCHTLWHHGLPALGIPGANNWAEHLEDVGRMYAVVEPDGGGEAFWERLAASPIREKLHRVDLEDAKDVSELHLKDPDGFAERIEEARSRARAWLDLAESEAQEKARESWAACEKLATAPDILALFAGEIGHRVAGEARTAKLLYLALTSRLLEKPVSVAVKGPSSGGKTYLVERVLDYFPGVANPPFSLEKWGDDVWVNYPYGRNFAGLPPTKYGDFAWAL